MLNVAENLPKPHCNLGIQDWELKYHRMSRNVESKQERHIQKCDTLHMHMQLVVYVYSVVTVIAYTSLLRSWVMTLSSVRTGNAHE